MTDKEALQEIDRQEKRFAATELEGSDMIATVNYHSRDLIS